jgi:hypothetical protein
VVMHDEICKSEAQHLLELFEIDKESVAFEARYSSLLKTFSLVIIGLTCLQMPAQVEAERFRAKLTGQMD